MRKIKNKNALKHGVYAEMVILPGEDQKEFEELHRSIIVEWQPVGPSESDAVLTLAQLYWRKRRYRRFQQRRIEAFLEYKDRRTKQNEKTYDRMGSLMELFDSEQPITEQMILETGRWRLADHFKIKVPRDNYSTEDQWRNALNAEICELADAYLLNRATATPIEDALTEESEVVRELGLDERIETLIDKAIKRIGHIKAMKSLGIGNHGRQVEQTPQKQIEAPSLKIGCD